VWHLQRNMTRWLLNKPGQHLNIAAMVERYAVPMAGLRTALPKVLPAESRADLQDDQALWVGKGFPHELARQLSLLPFLTYALDIIDIALERNVPVAEVGQAYFMLSDALHSKWLMDNVESLPVEGRWHAQARGVLRDELQAQQRALVSQVLTDARNGAGQAVTEWLARDDASLKYTLGMFNDMRNLRHMDYPTLSVAVRRLGHVVASAAGEN
ncbi:MAG: NAD-glutamate dehydrogenase, partial [Arenimonas sp.]